MTYHSGKLKRQTSRMIVDRKIDDNRSLSGKTEFEEIWRIVTGLLIAVVSTKIVVDCSDQVPGRNVSRMLC